MDETMAATVSQVISSKWTQASSLGLITLYLLKRVRDRAANRKIQSFLASRIEATQKERDESIDWARAEARLASDADRESIHRMDFQQLREALQSGEVTAESVIRVYYGLAVAAHEKTNCITKIVKESLAEARELDEKAKDPSYKKPRLFGMPISIKDSIELAGHRNTWGLAKLIDRIPKEDSYSVMKLRLDGMIPFCQTNLPTGCMSYTCVNSIFGTTTNPHDSSRTSGGSSGGEAALIVSGGSLIGLGTDLAGSSRIPAAFSGCCGFKPSATRCSTLQLPEPVLWRPIAMLTEGPLAREPQAIVEILRSQWSDNFIASHDAFSVPLNFREDLFKEGTKYRIGYFTTDGYIDPLPGNRRVVREAVELLKTKGYELVSFSMEDIVAETARGVFATVFTDPTAVAERLKDEPRSPAMAQFREYLSTPWWVKKLLGRMFKLRGDSTTADFFLSQSSCAIDVQAGVDKVYACRKRLLKKMKDERIDLLLCPSTAGNMCSPAVRNTSIGLFIPHTALTCERAFEMKRPLPVLRTLLVAHFTHSVQLAPAMPHDLPVETPFTSLFPTLLWNVMDFPAGVVTTDSWTVEDEAALDAYPEKGMVESLIKKGCRNSVGLPLSVQIVAPSFRDEIVLRVMVDLYDALKK